MAPKHTELMLVNTVAHGKTRMKKSWRHPPAIFAKAKVGKPYNDTFAFNKKIHANRYNCSQLVWAAWKDYAGIDLDNGLGKGVYPGDIREDERTHVYKKSI